MVSWQRIVLPLVYSKKLIRFIIINQLSYCLHEVHALNKERIGFSAWARKQPIFRYAFASFPANWRLRNKCRNASRPRSDWLKLCFVQSEVLSRSRCRLFLERTIFAISCTISVRYRAPLAYVMTSRQIVCACGWSKDMKYVSRAL